ncbi:MAG: TlpA family protein disulfide reductase [Bacteroidota bacterium]|nr:TlpA family protein disulfide reductase [Bacteroidota bacterium]
MKTRDYGLRPVKPKDASEGMLIYKLSETEKNRRDSLTAIAMANAPAPKESNYFKTGQKIYPFKEKDMDGNKFSLKDMTGKIIVLNFWFVGCPPCREEIPELNKIVEKYKDNPNVVFIAVALDDLFSIKEFLKTYPYNYHIIDNGKYIAQGMYKINSYPTNVVVDKKGIVRFHTSGVGLNTIQYMKKTIEELVAEK